MAEKLNDSELEHVSGGVEDYNDKITITVNENGMTVTVYRPALSFELSVNRRKFNATPEDGYSHTFNNVGGYDPYYSSDGLNQYELRVIFIDESMKQISFASMPDSFTIEQ